MRGSWYVFFFPSLPWLECRYMPGRESLALNLTNGHCTALKGLQRMHRFLHGREILHLVQPPLFFLTCPLKVTAEVVSIHTIYTFVVRTVLWATLPTSSGILLGLLPKDNQNWACSLREGGGRECHRAMTEFQQLFPVSQMQFCPNYVLPGALPPCQ